MVTAYDFTHRPEVQLFESFPNMLVICTGAFICALIWVYATAVAKKAFMKETIITYAMYRAYTNKIGGITQICVMMSYVVMWVVANAVIFVS